MLVVGAMTRSRQAQAKGRKTTSPAMRAAAALLALFLVASSFGQIAHLLLVQHAVCVEHGELVELQAHAAHDADGHATPGDEHPSGDPASPDSGVDHDHCQVLARGQHEQLLPAEPGASLAAAKPEAARSALAAPALPAPASPPLLLAPKTSPPRAAAFG